MARYSVWLAVTYVDVASVRVCFVSVVSLDLYLDPHRDSRGRVVTALLARAPATRACCCGEEVDITVGSQSLSAYV